MQTVQLRRWTRAEYDRMIKMGLFNPEDRVELIDGEILQVTPQSSRHATAIRQCTRALEAAFPSGSDVRPQLPLALHESSEPEPDVAVVPGGIADYRDAHPQSAMLVIEVSDSTLEFDRDRKGSLYARAGIPEYWIVNLLDRRLEIYREPREDADAPLGWRYAHFRHLGLDEAASPLMKPAVAIPVAQLIP